MKIIVLVWDAAKVENQHNTCYPGGYCNKYSFGTITAYHVKWLGEGVTQPEPPVWMVLLYVYICMRYVYFS